MEDRLIMAHFLISYDPPGDGNCQFSVVCEALRNIGLYQSVTTLREQIVEYLKDHPHMQNFITDAWPMYLQNMAKYGTLGDHFTVQAAVDLFNVRIYCHLFPWTCCNNSHFATELSPYFQLLYRPFCRRRW